MIHLLSLLKQSGSDTPANTHNTSVSLSRYGIVALVIIGIIFIAYILFKISYTKLEVENLKKDLKIQNERIKELEKIHNIETKDKNDTDGNTDNGI